MYVCMYVCMYVLALHYITQILFLKSTCYFLSAKIFYLKKGKCSHFHLHKISNKTICVKMCIHLSSTSASLSHSGNTELLNTHTHTHSLSLSLSLSLAIHLYHPSLLASLLGRVLCLRRADVDKSLLIGQVNHLIFLQDCAFYYHYGLWYGRQVAVQLLFGGVLLLAFVQDSKQYSWVLPFLLFMHVLC